MKYWTFLFKPIMKHSIKLNFFHCFLFYGVHSSACMHVLRLSVRVMLIYFMILLHSKQYFKNGRKLQTSTKKLVSVCISFYYLTFYIHCVHVSHAQVITDITNVNGKLCPSFRSVMLFKVQLQSYNSFSDASYFQN
jgi:uncharacterized membrane protein YGL010W